MKAELVVVYGKPRNQVKKLPVGDCLIGRGDECQIRANSPLVSRQHCLLRVERDRAVLIDLGSTNGTLMNGKRITTEQPLAPGDLVQIGPVVLEFRLEAAGAAKETIHGLQQTVVTSVSEKLAEPEDSTPSKAPADSPGDSESALRPV